MTNLLEDFKQDHTLLINTLTTVNKLGIGTREAQEKLMAAKNALLAHLRKEDQKLYPILKLAAAKDEKLKRKLELFAKDMDEISREATAFFQKYTGDNQNALEFATDFGRVFSRLNTRIRKEETYLYPEYDDIP